MDTKQEMLERVKALADKYLGLKKTVLEMVDELDKIEKEYTELVKKIKES